MQKLFYELNQYIQITDLFFLDRKLKTWCIDAINTIPDISAKINALWRVDACSNEPVQ